MKRIHKGGGGGGGGVKLKFTEILATVVVFLSFIVFRLNTEGIRPS